MKRLLAAVLCIVVPIAMFAADNGYKVAYDGGSVPDIKPGTDVKLYFDSNQIRLVKDKKDVVVIPVSAVTEISYGQDVHRAWVRPSVLLWSRLVSGRSWR
jgi:hypothetical protein